MIHSLILISSLLTIDSTQVTTVALATIDLTDGIDGIEEVSIMASEDTATAFM